MVLATVSGLRTGPRMNCWKQRDGGRNTRLINTHGAVDCSEGNKRVFFMEVAAPNIATGGPKQGGSADRLRAAVSFYTWMCLPQFLSPLSSS